MTPSEDPNQTIDPARRGGVPIPPDYKPNWKVIVPIVLISAVVLLVCLPVCALLIVNSSGCCLANGPEKIITFWASMIAGFLALFGMLVTGVFVITSLRVEATAQVQARSEAQKMAVKVSQDEARRITVTFLQEHKGEMFETLERASDDVAQVNARVSGVKEDVEKFKGEVTAMQGEAAEARTAFEEARRQTTNLVSETEQAINRARAHIATVANEAQGAIDGASQQVAEQRDDAIGAISDAREAVETAANEARDRINRAGDSPQGGDESR